MNSDILFTSTINDYLVMDQTGTRLNVLADNFYLASYDLLQEISQALDNDNHTLWWSHIHTLKGVAGIAGAKNIHDLCDTIRSRNNNGFIDSPIHIMIELHHAIDEYRDAVHQTLNALPDDKSKPCQ